MPDGEDKVEFSRQAWTQQLFELNPWVIEFAPQEGEFVSGAIDRSQDSEQFNQARLQATLDRCAAGRDVWNIWAKSMLELRDKLKTSGRWSKNETSDNEVATEQVLFLKCALVSFKDLCLAGGADFSGYLFPGETTFVRTRFGDKDRSPGNASFREAQFHGGYAWFDGAEFGAPAKPARGSADFKNARFYLVANYETCQINMPITFARAHFAGDATFTNTRFKEQATFEDAVFESDATFKSINSETGFTLSKVRFKRVPDFTESSFHRPPRLDNVNVRPAWLGTVFTFAKPQTWPDFFFLRWIKPDRDAPAKFRELKHFAMESKDGRSELNFNAEEIRSARWVKDWPWHPSFLFGYLYGIFSSFGRAVFKPLLLWALLTVSFVCVYLSAHLDHAASLKTYGLAQNGGLVTHARFTWRAWQNRLPCTRGEPGENGDIIGLKDNIRRSTDAVLQAVRLSLANAFVFGDLGGVEGARLAYGCLYGLERVEPYGQRQRTDTEQRSWFTVPHVPSSVLWAMRFQETLSALLILLFGLGLRNMLKLK